MSSVQRAPEFPQADLQIMPDVAYPLMSGHVRTLTGSLISGLNQTGAIAGAFADSSGEGSSNYAGGVYHSLWRSFRASRSVATYGRIYSGVTVDAVYVLIIIKT